MGTEIIKANSRFEFMRLNKVQSEQVGLDGVTARGIFGKHHKYSERERENIKHYEELKAEWEEFLSQQPKQETPKAKFDEQAYLERIAQRQKEENKRQTQIEEAFKNAFEKKRKELAKLGLDLVGFNNN